MQQSMMMSQREDKCFNKDLHVCSVWAVQLWRGIDSVALVL